MPEDEVQRAIQAVFRIEWPRLVAGLARLTRDVGLAEELAQDALVAALEAWPSAGVPDRPGAWLLATARNRALDRWRRERRLRRCRWSWVASCCEPPRSPVPQPCRLPSSAGSHIAPKTKGVPLERTRSAATLAMALSSASRVARNPSTSQTRR